MYHVQGVANKEPTNNFPTVCRWSLSSAGESVQHHPRLTAFGLMACFGSVLNMLSSELRHIPPLGVHFIKTTSRLPLVSFRIQERTTWLGLKLAERPMYSRK